MYKKIKNTNLSKDESYFKVALPKADAVLILGILSIVTCSMLGITGLLIGIITRKISLKSVELYNLAPELYLKSSFRNINTGRTCATIGIVLSSVFLVFVFIFWVIKGAILSIF